MATIPNIIIQKLASGAVIPGSLPVISAAEPNLETQVTKEHRGRLWRYDAIDSGSGGLFESPGRLIEKLLRQKKVPTGGIAGESDVRADTLGYTLRRVYFQGTGTTRLQGFLRDPWGTLTVVTTEAVTLVPTPNGSHRSISGVLANGNVLPSTVVLTFSSGQVLRDIPGDGVLRSDDGSIKGAINYATGEFRVNFPTGPGTGTTLSADYKYGSGSVDYEFLDTDKSHSVSSGVSLDPASFTWSPPPSGGGELLVPPGWQVRFVSTGALAAVGSLGILCGSGQLYLPGQQLPGFGVAE